MSIATLKRANGFPPAGGFLASHSRVTNQGGRIRLAALRVPLATKLVGANALAVALLCGVWLLVVDSMTPFAGVAIAGGVAAVLVLHFTLIVVALRPIRDLETVAGRVWDGDFGARVRQSKVADTEVLRVGAMFNTLLEGLATDRARMRALASDVIEAGDRDRAALARELHDSTAQRVAALMFELASAARDERNPVLAERLRAARDATEGILEEVRSLSQMVHTRVLDDLGLEAALRKLARDATRESGADVDVDAVSRASRLPPRVEAAFYSVAHEAVQNAIRHGAASRIRVELHRTPQTATLAIHDDGRGFDAVTTDGESGTGGILAMRERMALLDGALEIQSSRGAGTTVRATVPMLGALLSGSIGIDRAPPRVGAPDPRDGRCSNLQGVRKR
jgi:signal transduction histidine kinase